MNIMGIQMYECIISNSLGSTIKTIDFFKNVEKKYYKENI